MKMVSNKVIATTECFSFMNLGRLGFGCDLTSEKPNAKLGTVTTPFYTPKLALKLLQLTAMSICLAYGSRNSKANCNFCPIFQETVTNLAFALTSYHYKQ